jgi:putative salt-induced outer membrane protein
MAGGTVLAPRVREVLRMRPIVLCFFVLAISSLAAAQTPPAAGPPARGERKAAFSVGATGGNTDTQTFGAGGSLVFRPGIWTTEARMAFVRSENNDVTTAESLTADLRESRALSTRLEVFGRAGYLVNEFAGIDNRISVDGGLGYKVLIGPIHTVRLDAGLGYAHESRTTGADLGFPLANAGAAYKWQFSKTADLTNASLFTASLERADDWRASNVFALTAAMVRVLSLKLSHELKHLNTPVPGFKKTDTHVSVALVAGF